MGIVNDAFNDYLNDPVIFADFCNGLLYEGKKVVRPEELAEFQKFYQEDMRDRIGGKKKPRRERDVAKLLCGKNGFLIIAFENQNEEHLYMPLRCLEYELEDLKRQIRRMKRRYEQKKDLEPGAEFLSGLRRTDRMIPTVTILIYHGEGTWEAAESLQELMDLSGVDETMRALLADYKLRVYNLKELDESLFETGLRELIGMMKCRDSRERMQAYCREHEERFENMDDKTYDLICIMLHIKTLAGKKESCRRPEGRINMCKAFEDWAKEEQKKGEERGRQNGRREGEKRMAALMDRLLREERFEDAGKAARNAGERQKLYLEYGI